MSNVTYPYLNFKFLPIWWIRSWKKLSCRTTLQTKFQVNNKKDLVICCTFLHEECFSGCFKHSVFDRIFFIAEFRCYNVSVLTYPLSRPPSQNFILWPWYRYFCDFSHYWSYTHEEVKILRLGNLSKYNKNFYRCH